jgi:hypothetical protein
MTCGVAAAVTGTGAEDESRACRLTAQGDVDGGAPTSDRRVGGCAVRRPWLREHGVEHVARAVSIAKPTVYHCVRSREEILWSIHEEFIQLLTEQYSRRVSHGLGQ